MSLILEQLEQRLAKYKKRWIEQRVEQGEEIGFIKTLKSTILQTLNARFASIPPKGSRRN